MFSKIAILAAAATCAAAIQVQGDADVVVNKTEAHQVAFNGSLTSEATWKSYTAANRKAMAGNLEMRQARARAVAAYFASRSANAAAWTAEKGAKGVAAKAATAWKNASAASYRAKAANDKALGIEKLATKARKAAQVSETAFKATGRKAVSDAKNKANHDDGVREGITAGAMKAEKKAINAYTAAHAKAKIAKGVATAAHGANESS